jgi:hypothetical protein
MHELVEHGLVVGSNGEKVNLEEHFLPKIRPAVT